jgi:serine phosphatase RsbU (regulator of sigma subunit)
MNLSEIILPYEENPQMTAPSVNGSHESYFQAQALQKLSQILKWQEEYEDLKTWVESLLEELVPYVGGLQSTFFEYDRNSQTLTFVAGFALDFLQDIKKEYLLGEGFIGQVAKDRKPMILENDETFATLTSVKKIRLKTLMIFPLVYKNTLLGVVEINFPQSPPLYARSFLDKAMEGFSANLYISKQLRVLSVSDLQPDSQATTQLKTEEIQENELNTTDSLEEVDWQALMGILQESIILVDEEWMIVEHNPAFEELFGDKKHNGNNLRAYLNIMSYDVINIKEKLQQGLVCESIGIHKSGETFRVNLKSYHSKNGQRGILISPVYADKPKEEVNNIELKQEAEEDESANTQINELSRSLQKKDKQLQQYLSTAKHVQDMLLMPVDALQKVFPNLFIFYRPIEEVGGDFYWFTKEKDQVIIASIDCPGRGVGGSMMCMIVNNFLTQIVTAQKITSPDKILTHLHQYISSTKKTNDSFSRSGVEISICTLDLHRRTIEFAGAKQSLIYFQNKTLHELPGDNLSVGSFWSHYETQRTFQKETIQLKSDTLTTVYLTTDGYEDQFGGQKGRKFLRNNLRKMLQEIHTQPIEKQSSILEEIMEEWQNKEAQTDDMLIIGFQI